MNKDSKVYFTEPDDASVNEEINIIVTEENREDRLSELHEDNSEGNNIVYSDVKKNFLSLNPSIKNQLKGK